MAIKPKFKNYYILAFNGNGKKSYYVFTQLTKAVLSYCYYVAEVCASYSSRIIYNFYSNIIIKQFKLF